MEVHAHTHTSRKKWTHYFWEFFMLFLAVFCGFLAENFREHQVEKKRAREYIISFYEDLKKDTATFSKITRDNENKLSKFADIFSCYDTVSKNWQSTSCLGKIARASRSNAILVFSTGTLQQLKNAGGYRLLSKEDKDSIQGYDISIEGYKNFESSYYQESQDILRSTFSIIEDFNANKFLFRKEAGADSSHVETSLLFSDDKALLNKYFNDLFRYKLAIISQNQNIKVRKQKADGLLAYFKNKYQLE